MDHQEDDSDWRSNPTYEVSLKDDGGDREVDIDIEKQTQPQHNNNSSSDDTSLHLSGLSEASLPSKSNLSSPVRKKDGNILKVSFHGTSEKPSEAKEVTSSSTIPGPPSSTPPPSPSPQSNNNRKSESSLKPLRRRTSGRRLFQHASSSSVNENRMIVELVTGLKEPMNPQLRKRKEFLIGRPSTWNHHNSPHISKSMRSQFLRESPDDKRQYRLTSSRSESGGGGDLTSTNTSHARDIGKGNYAWATYYRGGLLFANFVNWSFKVTFGKVMVSLIAVYFMLTLWWAIIIYVAGVHQPQCFYVSSDKNFETAGNHFGDAYYISWTTFSTVGYGVAGPAPSDISATCMVLNILVALEAFCGVLYASFAGAVILGKVRRNQAKAHVLWSEPVVVRFDDTTGTTVDANRAQAAISGQVHVTSSTCDTLIPEEADPGSSEEFMEDSFQLETLPELSSTQMNSKPKATTSKKHPHRNPFPVLEFRILNQFHNENGSQIVNASLQVWTSALAEKCSSSTRAHVNLLNSAKKDMQVDLNRSHSQLSKLTGDVVLKAKKTAGRVSNAASGLKSKIRTPRVSLRKSLQHQNSSHNGSEGSDHLRTNPSSEETNPFRTSLQRQASLQRQKSRRSVMVTEDPDGSGLIPQKIYSKLKVDSNHHPFFQNVWTIRHVLTAKSPLISDKAQKMILANGGYWPDELYTREQLQKHVIFHEIMVSFQGMSHMYGASVFSQHVYDVTDVNFGHTFVNLIQKDYETQTSFLDDSLLNETVPQTEKTKEE